MGRHFQAGFTIIETMLVLAITGVLIAGLLVGLGASIGVQRYKDAVSTFKSQVQSQYSQIENVTNDRNENWTCGTNAAPVEGGSGTAPGQTDCVVLGRYMAIEGSNITTATITGYQVSNDPGYPTLNDVGLMKANYNFGISNDTITTSTLEWGAQIAWPASGEDSRTNTTPRSIAILILRSPDSGTTYTFTSDTVENIEAVSSQVLKDMMVENTAVVPGQMRRTLCIDPNGINVSEKLAVYIEQASSGASSIESRSNATTLSLKGTAQC